MIQDMVLAGFSEGTQRVYINAIRQLAGYYKTAPNRLTEKQVQDYMLYLRVEKKVAKGTFQSNFGAMKFLYLVTLDYSWPLFVKKKFASRFKSGFPMHAATPTVAA